MYHTGNEFDEYPFYYCMFSKANPTLKQTFFKDFNIYGAHGLRIE